jgi:Family of unknown function (DUF5687)
MKLIQHFLSLEWKSFSRSASFGANMALKILMAILALLYSFALLSMGIGLFYGLKENQLDPLVQVNTFLIYYFLFDLAIRFLWQKIPVINIRPILILPIKKSTIVHFSLCKTALSFFNLMHVFFFLPFSVVLYIENYPIDSIISWHLAMFSIVYINNFINVLFSNKDNLFGILLAIVVVLGGLQRYGYFNITDYSAPFFEGLFHTPGLFLLPVGLLLGLYKITYDFFKNQLYLDAGLATKSAIAKTENLNWLNQFGTLGTFLKNDIKLIKRNKRSKTTVGMSILFLFYGLIFFRENSHQPQVMQIFAGIFVSGGFLFTFGQFVPSWDSQYYPLMMTQNISYKNYLTSKWWLIVIATVISTILCSFYIYLGWQIYLTILAGAIYNIGINSHLVLYAGAYTKTPIDLSSSKGAFGDKKAFNLQTTLISLPKIVLPVLLYALGKYIEGPNTGLALVAATGILGFALRDRVFSQIEKVYKVEKYKTIQAYKQNN